VVIISTTDDVLSINPVDGTPTFIVKYQPEAGVINGNGEVTFYEFEGNNPVEKGSSLYLGEGLLLGAIIAHDKELYDCQLAKATKRLALLTDLHLKRAELYSVEGNPSCSFYPDASLILEAIHSQANNGMPGLNREMMDNINSLKSLNDFVVRERGECAPLY